MKVVEHYAMKKELYSFQMIFEVFKVTYGRCRRSVYVRPQCDTK